VDLDYEFNADCDLSIVSSDALRTSFSGLHFDDSPWRDDVTTTPFHEELADMTTCARRVKLELPDGSRDEFTQVPSLREASTELRKACSREASGELRDTQQLNENVHEK